ncbi:MAG TPA: LysM peptidoglycan-binding domain-containing protein [Patescibacteria group bacterium]|nr:LysM peptidoglycan-binding domain-containing protein [Patescibacteria group bacterium]
MPRGRRKPTTTEKRHVTPIRPSKNQEKAFQWNPLSWFDSYTSFLMGIIVVIVATLFIVSLVRQTRHVQQTSSITAVPTVLPTTKTLHVPQTISQQHYTVKRGDDLWHISERFYKSGYNWVDIAGANHLVHPGTIHSGNILVIPSVAPKIATFTPAPVKPVIMRPITGGAYTVVKGDDLWNIALRAYGNPYRYVDLIKANNLKNPSLIFSGNVLKIPR